MIVGKARKKKGPDAQTPVPCAYCWHAYIGCRVTDWQRHGRKEGSDTLGRGHLAAVISLSINVLVCLHIYLAVSARSNVNQSEKSTRHRNKHLNVLRCYEW